MYCYRPRWVRIAASHAHGCCSLLQVVVRGVCSLIARGQCQRFKDAMSDTHCTRQPTCVPSLPLRGSRDLAQRSRRLQDDDGDWGTAAGLRRTCHAVPTFHQVLPAAVIALGLGNGRGHHRSLTYQVHDALAVCQRHGPWPGHQTPGLAHPSTAGSTMCAPHRHTGPTWLLQDRQHDGAARGRLGVSGHSLLPVGLEDAAGRRGESHRHRATTQGQDPCATSLPGYPLPLQRLIHHRHHLAIAPNRQVEGGPVSSTSPPHHLPIATCTRRSRDTMGAEQSTPAAAAAVADAANGATSVPSQANLPSALVVVGPSGVGKNSLINKLIEGAPDKFSHSISHTTRQPRTGEKVGEACKEGVRVR